MIITLTYKEAREINHYLKAWERVRDTSKSGELKFDQDKIEYDRDQDKVEIELLP